MCRRTGIVPWCIVHRLTSSMYMPHVHLFVWEGVILMITFCVVVRVIGGAIGSPECHWRMKLCMRPMALGVCRLSES